MCQALAASVPLALILLSGLGPGMASAGCDSQQSSSTPGSRYEIKGGEVYDKVTRLTWQRCSVGQHWRQELGCVGVIRQMTWQEAMGQAADGWRLPTVDELKTLIASNCSSPAINEEVFPDMELYKLWYWTSTDTGSSVWYVAFGAGSVHNADRTDLNAVRLVRSAGWTRFRPRSADLARHEQGIGREHSLHSLGDVRRRQRRAGDGGDLIQ